MLSVHARLEMRANATFWHRSINRRWAAEFLQALTALLPGTGIETANGRQFINFESSNYLAPKDNSVGVTANGLRNLPQPGSLAMAARQGRLAIGAKSCGLDLGI